MNRQTSGSCVYDWKIVLASNATGQRKRRREVLSVSGKEGTYAL